MDKIDELDELDTLDELETTQKGEVKHPVIELFGPVIQGEGSQCGRQTMFIRFAGCDYRCRACDSLHAVNPLAIKRHRKWMTVGDIVAALSDARERTGVQWVTFSGGNPCIHNLTKLVIALREADWYINVETQGTLYQSWLAGCTTVTVSPKPFGMGEKFEADKYTRFLRQLAYDRIVPLCVKVPIFSTVDLEFALTIEDISKEHYDNKLLMFYLSLGNPYPPILNNEYNLVENYPTPDFNLPAQLLHDYRELSEEVLQDKRLKNWRFLPQIHVLVYGNETGR